MDSANTFASLLPLMKEAYATSVKTSTKKERFKALKAKLKEKKNG